MEQSQRARKSNFELCRIVLMMLIISGHLTTQSGIMSSDENKNIIWAMLFGSGAWIANNVFVMIGAYFLVDKPFKAERIVKLYAEVWFYCVPITIIMSILTPSQINIINFIRGLFPYSGSPLVVCNLLYYHASYDSIYEYFIKKSDKDKNFTYSFVFY